ncbi:DUF6888 family protein [Fischerella thermalis]|uniref:DUF6888 domain-containing protein n=1 Tax=Fischerella thermalis CCMEE 5318 TaxID=2019666 RepID=A0A2N6LG95_9CYAN|nr:hypothetical protein [Fischerella thermalis]PMB18949.1 hypothetical protein CEN47_23800 [Fischerella thermalis CCMEE 5319]PMB22846.1 hypothetical protein CEN46_11560 [Fischerella thermalis CCMEE 5318]
MKKPVEPMPKQAIAAIIVCAQLTRVYKRIDLVRLDERDGSIYILANDSIEAQIKPNGEVIWL